MRRVAAYTALELWITWKIAQTGTQSSKEVELIKKHFWLYICLCKQHDPIIVFYAHFLQCPFFYLRACCSFLEQNNYRRRRCRRWWWRHLSMSNAKQMKLQLNKTEKREGEREDEKELSLTREQNSVLCVQCNIIGWIKYNVIVMNNVNWWPNGKMPCKCESSESDVLGEHYSCIDAHVTSSFQTVEMSSGQFVRIRLH